VAGDIPTQPRPSADRSMNHVGNYVIGETQRGVVRRESQHFCGPANSQSLDDSTDDAVRRGLRAGDSIRIEVRPSLAPGRLVAARVLAREAEQLLVIVTPGDLAGLSMSSLEGERHVIASWSNGRNFVHGGYRVRDMSQHPVGVLRLDDSEPLDDRDRRRPRLRRSMPAQLWTPETGDVTASVIDLSLGARGSKSASCRTPIQSMPPLVTVKTLFTCQRRSSRPFQPELSASTSRYEFAFIQPVNEQRMRCKTSWTMASKKH
jgi:hypothetical protein